MTTSYIFWPKRCQPRFEIIRAPADFVEIGNRDRICSDASRVQIGNCSFRCQDIKVKQRSYRPTVLKTDSVELEAWIPSWVQGGFDAEVTELFGDFCQAAVDGNREKMRKIADGVRRMYLWDYLLAFGQLFLMSVIFCYGVFSGWSEWILFLPCLLILIGATCFREHQRKRLFGVLLSRKPKPSLFFWR